MEVKNLKNFREESSITKLKFIGLNFELRAYSFESDKDGDDSDEEDHESGGEQLAILLRIQHSYKSL